MAYWAALPGKLSTYGIVVSALQVSLCGVIGRKKIRVQSRIAAQPSLLRQSDKVVTIPK